MMKKLFTFFVLLTSFHALAANYYWVGGSGNWTDINHWRTSSGGTSLPSVVPGPTDNVFFDANSGFTASSKTVTIDNVANCHNITFSGSTIAPTLTEKGTQTLNIYGSSEWQTGMGIVVISNIYYLHTGEAKTIKSNGVVIGNFAGNVHIEEENSISLMDDFNVSRSLNINAGTFNTNNYTLTVGYMFKTNTSKAKKLNLGSSHIYITWNNSSFDTTEATTIVDAGTSKIHFLDNLDSNNGLKVNSTQTYYDVTFEGVNGSLNGSAKFNRVEFKNNGNIRGSNTFKELIFSPAKTYSLQSGSTQTITSLLSADTAQCTGWATIISNTKGSQSNIIASASVSVNISGAVIKDLKVSGGASFVANNSIDDGNNSGLTFPPYVGKDLYWIGGSGNWNDKSHWSQTSNGVGGYCVPGSKDNTFFDVNSGFNSSTNKTVTIDNTSYTHNITFSGSAVAPTLTQNGTQILNIYGSSEWQIGMTVDIKSIYYRNSNEPKTIKSNKVITGSLNADISFQEESSISFLDDFAVSHILNHEVGTLNTNNNKLTIGYLFNLNDTKSKTINLGSSHVYFLKNDSRLNSGINTIVNAGTSNIHFLDAVSTSVGLLANSTQTYYDVTFEGSVGSLSGSAKFNRVEFKNNGNINGSNTFKELVFSPTKSYILDNNTTQTITNLFDSSTPQCGGWTTIKSKTDGVQANIVAASGVNVKVSGAVIQDIKVSGGASFTALNSVDNGNNAGWTFPSYVGQSLYWIGGLGNWNDKSHWSKTSGGIGGYCVPGPKDDTFFDVNSGFNSTTNKTVTIDNISYTKNITFSGNSIAPTITGVSGNDFNIYGSSEWQKDMTIGIQKILYRNSNEPKTIKSNQVKTGSNGSSISFQEESSISFLDDFTATQSLILEAGTLNTNNNKLSIGYQFNSRGTKTKTINLGSSQVYFINNVAGSAFNTNNDKTTLNSGTSRIHFGYNTATETAGIVAYPNQTYYDVVFEGPAGVVNGGAKFNRVEYKNNGFVNGNNTFKDLIFTAGKTYTLQNATTQTIENWTLGGTPCDVTFVQSSTAGTRANINITGSTTEFNFGNLKDINASGKPLHFGEQSTLANQNNTNITYDPYNPGAFEGLGADWIDHKIDSSDPSTYILSASKFYGNNYTTYKWYKIAGLNSSSTNVISTDKEIDIRKFGYGTYEVKVDYSNGNTVTCSVNDDILLKGILKKALVNPSTRIRVQ